MTIGKRLKRLWSLLIPEKVFPRPYERAPLVRKPPVVREQTAILGQSIQ